MITENDTQSVTSEAPETGGIPKLSVEDVNLGAILGEAWEGYKEHLGTIFIGYLIYTIITSTVSNMGPLLLFVLPHMAVGLNLMCLKAVRGEEAPDLADLFRGFSLYGPVLVAGLLYIIGIFIGTLLLVVPGIILYLMLSQAYFLLADDVMDVDNGVTQKNQVNGFGALESSNKLMRGWKLKFFMYVLVIGLIVFSGVLVAGIGIMFTLPFGTMACASFYNRIKQVGPIA